MSSLWLTAFPPFKQLKCIGGNARGLYEVDVMRCKNQGADYDDEKYAFSFFFVFYPISLRSALFFARHRPDSPPINTNQKETEERWIDITGDMNITVSNGPALRRCRPNSSWARRTLSARATRRRATPTYLRAAAASSTASC